jgi:CDGSH-type Zn-finger protein
VVPEILAEKVKPFCDGEIIKESFKAVTEGALPDNKKKKKT